MLTTGMHSKHQASFRLKIMSAALAVLVALTLLPSCKAVAKPQTPPPSSSQTLSQNLPPMSSPASPNTAAAISSTQPIPPEYQRMYDDLQAAMNAFDAALSKRGTAGDFPVVFGTELLVANGNRGPELLKHAALQGVGVFLDRFQEMGIKGITIAVNYPLYTPDFPNYQDYVPFFKQVAAQVRSHGMKLDAEAGVMFANTDFSPVKYDFKDLTFDKYKQAKKTMFQAIINDLHPDYLNIGSEPDTAYALTGLKELLDPQKFTELITYALDGLDKGNTKIVAGIGSWGNMQYIRDLADTGIDDLDVHIYPVVGNCLSQALEIADIAAQHGKGVVLDECWLYKATALSGSGVATAPEIFKRDNFSFWTPLDEQFLTLMAKYAKVCKVEYVSPFWSNFFFGGLDYTPELNGQPYTSVVAQANQVESQGVVTGKSTPLGDYYRELIAENRK